MPQKKTKLKKSNIDDDSFSDESDLLQDNFDRQSRTVFLFDDIDGHTVLKCMKALMILDKSPGDITLIINCEGGSTIDGWGLIDFIRNMKNSVNGVVYGGAFSMASVILQICKERAISKHSCLLIHAGSIETNSDTNSAIKNAEFLKKDLEITMDLYRSRSRISPKKIKELMSQDSFIDAHDSLKYGLVDKII